MKVHVSIQQQNINVDEDFEGANSDELVGKMKARVAKELPFAMRVMVNAMSNLMFAQEVVKRYNQNSKKDLPSPQSCDEFLTLAQEQGFATVL